MPANALEGIRSIRDLPIEQKRLFLRVDFNVPLEGGGAAAIRITDDSRIREALPTIKHAIERGARVVCASHLGRPKKGPDPRLSLEPCAARLAELLGQDVTLPEDCVGDAAKKVVYDLRAGQVCLLENLRYHAEEEKDDEGFCKELAELADVYVDDAFGAVHRAHASVHGLAKLYRERGCGFLLEKEIAALGKIVTAPDKPYVAILGGAKVSDKIAVVESLLERVTALVIGGAMANTFLAAQGVNVGKSLQEAEMHDTARRILEPTKMGGCQVVLPLDAVVATEFKPNAATRTVGINGVPDDAMILDVGPATVAELTARLGTLKTLVWNGPLGAFETPPFDAGTTAFARAVAAATQAGGLRSVAGGGDTVSALRHAGVLEQMSYVSTAGGAFLEWLEGKTLPGVAALAV
jgi:phosphoglycerate kinase